MAKIIKGDKIVEDTWQLLREPPAEALPNGQIIVPLQYWLEQREILSTRGNIGVWLASDQSPSTLAADLNHIELVAIDFPAFTDGRGFSYARTLREHYGYKGEIRAIGQFIRDQLYYLRRCGFDAFAIETADPEKAVGSLNDFSTSYSASIDQPAPWFRRHNA